MLISLRCIRTALLFTAASAFPSTIITRHPLSTPHSSSFARQTMTRHHSSSNPSGSGPFPELCVFDLDACFWDQEMYTLSHIPQETNVVRGDLMGRGEGVVGVMSGRERISLHKGSLLALQAHYHGEYPGMKVCFASSADTPLAEKIGRAALKLLEVVPGTTVWDLVVNRDWNGVDVNQIGRQPPLSANKSATHFPILREVTKIRYDRMLFFDDCIWGDHCGQVERACRESDSGRGVVTVRTPYGLREEEWREGLVKYAKLFQE